VLSPLNPEQDLDTKRDAYARAGVAEYWVVRPETRDMLVFWEPDTEAGAYAQERHVAANAIFDSPTFPIQLTIAALFAGSPDMML
jgi:Uma2 family endonuclease